MAFVFPVFLILIAHQSDALAFSGTVSAEEKQAAVLSNNLLHVSADGSGSHQPKSARSAMTMASPLIQRPSFGKKVDMVKFGVWAKNFYGTDLKKMTFKLDMVLSLRWVDQRVTSLIPAGVDKLTLAWDQALKKVWMPAVVVTNRDIDKYEIISSSVTVFRTGEVLRVERAQTRIMKKFLLEDYPFDKQDLEVKVASSKYMLDEVALVPDVNASGVDEDIWGLYSLKKWNTEVFEDRDRYLQKSRGVLNIYVKRQLGKYFDDHLVPTAIILTISCAVFYFPFAGPFVTPRLALSILSLLQFTNLLMKSAKELPGSAPFNWNDLFNQQIQAMMFITITLNIFTEIAHHTFLNEKVARMTNHEGKILIPLLSLVNVVIVLGSGSLKWMTLFHATILTKALIICTLASYGAKVYSTILKDRLAKEEAAAKIEP